MENSHGCRQTTKDVSVQELRDKHTEFAGVRGGEQCQSPRNLLLALVIPEFGFVNFPHFVVMSIFIALYSAGGGTIWGLLDFHVKQVRTDGFRARLGF